MTISEEGERELQRLADDVGDIGSRLRAFGQKQYNAADILTNREYLTLRERLSDLTREFNSIT